MFTSRKSGLRITSRFGHPGAGGNPSRLPLPAATDSRLRGFPLARLRKQRVSALTGHFSETLVEGVSR